MNLCTSICMSICTYITYCATKMTAYYYFGYYSHQQYIASSLTVVIVNRRHHHHRYLVIITLVLISITSIISITKTDHDLRQGNVRRISSRGCPYALKNSFVWSFRAPA
ncbi:hypothetical protein F5B19DRAFT_456077 [Rostrohypoxylon terebratum]|nr:hypothetical protein F5B19DRAFT_456077 [Rostrohypoxylon terebratum]